ncbi:hypothetical protein B0H13DRAFT_2341539 [Mycena leptocephala]|nr:hypothetical protein B0H13DRAFT_2341539 [Mycena leptocephala]
MPKDRRTRPRNRQTTVRMAVDVPGPNGKPRPELRTLGQKERSHLNTITNIEMLERIAALPKEKRAAFERLRDMPDNPMDHSDDEVPATFNYGDVAEGNIDISHAGGEMADLQDDLNQELNGKKKRHDRRRRSDATQRRVLGFRAQMKAMTDAYVQWGATQGEFGVDSTTPPPEPETVETYYKVSVIDVLSSYTVEAPLTGNDVYIASGLVGQGLIPCSPWTPKVTVTIRLLEMYRVAHLRCPTLGIQAWLKTLADLHGTAFRPYRTQQFSTCFDVYLEILKNVDDRVKKALWRDAPDWHLKNGCPACTYKGLGLYTCTRGKHAAVSPSH